MKKTVAIGIQDFAKLIEKNCFYVDKTSFIKEWWEHEDDVTLITRPRRFGKTLNKSMLEYFFSNKYAGRGEELFGGLEVWQDEKLRAEQGQWPVIFLSFAGIKNKSFNETRKAINQLITNKYDELRDTLDYNNFSPREKPSNRLRTSATIPIFFPAVFPQSVSINTALLSVGASAGSEWGDFAYLSSLGILNNVLVYGISDSGEFGFVFCQDVCFHLLRIVMEVIGQIKKAPTLRLCLLYSKIKQLSVIRLEFDPSSRQEELLKTP